VYRFLTEPSLRLLSAHILFLFSLDTCPHINRSVLFPLPLNITKDTLSASQVLTSATGKLCPVYYHNVGGSKQSELISYTASLVHHTAVVYIGLMCIGNDLTRDVTSSTYQPSEYIREIHQYRIVPFSFGFLVAESIFLAM
jgi:hypothetical protein